MLDRLTFLFATTPDASDRSVEQYWDELRDAATTEAERTEIDAIFGRHAA